MSITIFLSHLALACLTLTFPILIYLIYIAYIKTVAKEENKFILSIAILMSLLITKLVNANHYYYIYCLLSAPLLLCYLSKKTILGIVISLYLAIYSGLVYKIDLQIQGIEYLAFFLVYLKMKQHQNFHTKYPIYFISIKLVFMTTIFCYLIPPIGMHIYNISSVLVVMITLTLFSLIGIYLFNKSKKIIDLKTALKRLDRETNLKSSIFKLTHELKNPLAVCNGYLEMLETGEVDPKKEEQYLNIIKEEIKRSLTIINDFSSLGKIKQLDYENLDLAVLFEDIYDIIAPLYKENNAIITLPEEDEFYIDGDYNRLKQVFFNILKNSIEAKNDANLKVEIKVKKSKNNYKITITDNASGMTKEELTHIYDMFYTSKLDGTGIGVPYIREIINLHNGKINYQSQKNKGTTVTILLPI